MCGKLRRQQQQRLSKGFGIKLEYRCRDYLPYSGEIRCHQTQYFCVIFYVFLTHWDLKAQLQSKLIFQELCRNKLEWDKVINDRNIINKWAKFLHDLGQFRLINALTRHAFLLWGSRSRIARV